MKLIIISKEYYRRLFNTVLMLLEGELAFSKFASLVKLQKESATWVTIDKLNSTTAEEMACILCEFTGSYLGFKCNFCFLQMTYFWCQMKIWAWSAQPTFVSELPLQLGSRGSQSSTKQKDLKFYSNNHST